MNKALNPVQTIVIVAVVLAVVGFLAYRYVFAPSGSSHATMGASSRSEMLSHIHGAQTGPSAGK